MENLVYYPWSQMLMNVFNPVLKRHQLQKFHTWSRLVMKKWYNVVMERRSKNDFRIAGFGVRSEKHIRYHYSWGWGSNIFLYFPSLLIWQQSISPGTVKAPVSFLHWNLDNPPFRPQCKRLKYTNFEFRKVFLRMRRRQISGFQYLRFVCFHFHLHFLVSKVS